MKVKALIAVFLATMLGGDLPPDYNEEMLALRAHIRQQCPDYSQKDPSDQDRMCVWNAFLDQVKKDPPKDWR